MNDPNYLVLKGGNSRIEVGDYKGMMHEGKDLLRIWLGLEHQDLDMSQVLQLKAFIDTWIHEKRHSLAQVITQVRDQLGANTNSLAMTENPVDKARLQGRIDSCEFFLQLIEKQGS